MLGKRSEQKGLWEVDRLYLDYVGQDTFYGLLASLRGQLFSDDDFAEIFGCSWPGDGFLLQKPLSQMDRSTFLPLQHTATLIFSVDWQGNRILKSAGLEAPNSTGARRQAVVSPCQNRLIQAGRRQNWPLVSRSKLECGCPGWIGAKFCNLMQL